MMQQCTTPQRAIKAGDDNLECDNEHLNMLIKNATSSDISSLPTVVQDRLDTLARIAALLGLDYPTRLAYASSLSKLSDDHLRVQLHVIQLKKVEKELRDVIDLARHRQMLTVSWDNVVQNVLPDTASLGRQTKSMLAKARDYQRELNIVTEQSEIYSGKDEVQNITSLLSLQEKLNLKEQEVKVLKARLKAFQGLPPNLELAKVELASARENQLRLIDIREKLLKRMTHGLI